jgi:hypothetical protein
MLISERPVGGMDWTPNSMSLEEITTEVNEVDGKGVHDEDDAEPMDLD